MVPLRAYLIGKFRENGEILTISLNFPKFNKFKKLFFFQIREFFEKSFFPLIGSGIPASNVKGDLGSLADVIDVVSICVRSCTFKR